MIRGLLRRLAGAPKLPGSVVELVRDIAAIARDRAEFRQRLMRAAEQGDLDEAFDRFRGANARAREYMEGGR